MQAKKQAETEFRKRFDAGVWRKLFRLLKPYKGYYLGLLAVVILMAGVEVSFPLVVRYAVDRGITPQNTAEIYRSVLMYLGLVVLQSLLVWAFIAGCGRVGARVMSDLRQRMFDHIQTLSISYFDKTPMGWIMSRMLSDSQRVGETISWGAVDFVWGIIMMILMAGAMLTVNWKLASAVLCLIPLLLYVSFKFQKLILAMYRKIRKLNSEITAGYNEGITGVRVIKSLCRENAVSEEFGGLADTMYQASYRSAVLSSMYLPIVHIIGAIGCALVVAMGGSGVVAGSITLGTLVAFISYTQRFFDPANEIARVFGQLQETQASAERLFSLMETQSEVRDRKNARTDIRFRGHIQYKNVRFSYDDKSNVLHDFTLDVQAGQKIALVGPTGGGKTTVVNLLMRLYEVSGGQILIDGIDLKDMTIHSIRAQMGVVLQTPYLFSGTLKENIRYGRLNATDEEIFQAAHTAGIHEMILDLPGGYETEIRENGEPLSTGQKQLVSLTRAILADPSIFIMDEATSSVDTETEDRIQKATETVLDGRTSFIIAHRLSTIRNADKILVIDAGRIVESGTHLELLNQEGHYNRLYTQQFLSMPQAG